MILIILFIYQEIKTLCTEILEIKISGKKETEMLPFTKQYVPTINLEEGYIIVSSATMLFADEEEE